MSRDERERLRDIKDAIVAIRDHLAGAGEAPADNQAALLHDALLEHVRRRHVNRLPQDVLGLVPEAD